MEKKLKNQLAEQHWHLEYAMAKSEEIKPYVERDFLAGYEAAEQQSDEFAIGFSEWIAKNEYHYVYEHNMWTRRGMGCYLTRHVLENYKQSLKQ